LALSVGFYSTRSPLFATDKRINICKDCFISNALSPDTGEVDETKFKNLLRKTDFPYYRDILQASANQYVKEHGYISDDDVKYHGRDIVKLYMKNINSLQQLSGKTFEDSEKNGFISNNCRTMKNPDEEIKLLANKVNKKVEPKEEKHYSDIDGFEVTDEIKDLFGDGYTTMEYKKMHEKYEKLKLNYSLQTNLHQEALATYVRFKVKEEMATAAGNVDDAKKWYDAAQNAADKAKLSPKQLTQADLQGGINSFSEIFKAVEQTVDVVPILPRFKYRPNDACDFIIWCYINYARDLQGLPSCEYKDVYKFYDKKKKEYISQYGDPYGIFDEDPTEDNRANIKKFITLPKDYADGDG
jgi:hypothetical protein